MWRSGRLLFGRAGAAGRAAVGAGFAVGAIKQSTLRCDDNTAAPAQATGSGYCAIFLDKESSEKLRSEIPLKFSNQQCHHVTLKYNPSNGDSATYEPLMGTHAVVKVVGLAEDDHAQAVLVDVLGAGGPIRSANNFPHVTLSCEDAEGLYSPRYSNDLFDRLEAEGVLSSARTAKKSVKRKMHLGTLPEFTSHSDESRQFESSKVFFKLMNLKLTGVVCTSLRVREESGQIVCAPPSEEERAQEKAYMEKQAQEQEQGEQQSADSIEGETNDSHYKGLKRGEEEEDDQETECGFCLFMRAGPCGDQFRSWERCLARCKKDETDFLEHCGAQTLELKDCVDLHPDYYSVLDSEEGEGEGEGGEKEKAKESEGEGKEGEDEAGKPAPPANPPPARD